ncbi:MAG: NUDIX hydrolase [Desulfobacterales bacterium]|nr:MAG: NUDIX hydrolase [Desulfobacterales bacterium]
MIDKNSLQGKAKINKSTEIYRGKHFSFVTEDITLPNGIESEIAMVRHPGSTAIVPLLDNHTVVMTRQYRHPVREYVIEIPAGTMEPGESPANCAKRELEEETGYMANELVELSHIHMLPAYSDEKIYLYLAQNLTKTQQNLDREEIIHTVTYSLDETLKLIENGSITDALTIMAIYRAWIYLQDSG